MIDFTTHNDGINADDVEGTHKEGELPDSVTKYDITKVFGNPIEYDNAKESPLYEWWILFYDDESERYTVATIYEWYGGHNIGGKSTDARRYVDRYLGSRVENKINEAVNKLVEIVAPYSGNGEEKDYVDIGLFGEPLTRNVYNLDVLSQEELQTIDGLIDSHWEHVAEEFFGDNWRDYVTEDEINRVLSILQLYCSNKSMAISARLKGDIKNAMYFENACEILYQELPDWSRW